VPRSAHLSRAEGFVEVDQRIRQQPLERGGSLP
jgi:hypothetical protein